MRKTLTTLGLLAFALLCGYGANAATFYVKASGTGNGSSWSTASGNLQTTITAAASGDSVFVAAGSYNLTSDITLKEGVQLFGGFAGTETATRKRLKADKDANGSIEPWEYAKETCLFGNGAKRVFTQAAAFTAPTVIDGFNIQGGKETNGGGVYLLAGSVLKNCIVTNNIAASNGGGVYLNGAAMQGCAVSNNTYNANGGGVYATASASVHGCKIQNNKIQNGEVNVGDMLSGGIVFYVNNTTRTAYIMSLTESSIMTWAGAAAWCISYNGGNQTGWSLPTCAQLQQMYIVKALLNNELSGTGGAQVLDTETCWSSDNSGATASIVCFDNGYAGNLDKTNTGCTVRAIRSVTF